MSEEIDRQRHLVEGLLDPRAYPHPAEQVEHIETHISHILLAGGYAYKIKKPLNLGFLDYHELAQRHHYCREELRLNGRTAPDIYLDVVGIGGSPDVPRIVAEESSECMEYAVRMRRFPLGSLLSERLQAGTWEEGVIDVLAEEIAAFHRSAAVAGPDTQWATPAQVHQPVKANFLALAGQCDAARLQALADWAEQSHQGLREIFEQRRQAGCIRECHGDLHLGNIVMWEGQPRLFDGIEFNEGLRWIDVINDIAFLMMDLEERGRRDDAWQLINRYLEFTGDYAGVAVLDYYRAYRALVRAKVATIRLGQNDLAAGEWRETKGMLQAYLDLAWSYTRPSRPCLLLTSGLSGSGKTWVSSLLEQSLGLIRVRSDVERKRLFGLGPLERSASAVDAGIYTPEAGRRTYQRLRELAGVVLDAGHPVIVDAAFLGRVQRRDFLALADQQGVPALIIHCVADPDTLRQRILQRHAAGLDASEADLAVLGRQLGRNEPPEEDEGLLTLTIDTQTALDSKTLAGQVRDRLGC